LGEGKSQGRTGKRGGMGKENGHESGKKGKISPRGVPIKWIVLEGNPRFRWEKGKGKKGGEGGQSIDS